MTNALGTRKETGRAACIGNTYQEKLISELDVQLVAENSGDRTQAPVF